MPQYNSALGLVHFATQFMDSIADTRFADLLDQDSFYDPRLELQNLWLQFQGCHGDATQENILSAQISHLQHRLGMC